MLTKRFVVLGAIAILPAFAQVPSAPLKTGTTQPAAPRYHAPMRGLVDYKNGTVTTGNWSGYAVTGTGFTRAVGSWTVPALMCTSGTEYAVFWVGIDGYSDETVEQTGTEGVCSGTTATYSAWYEYCCSEPIITITGMTVKPGDKMLAAIIYNTGTSEFTVEIKDDTTGQTFSKTKSFPSAQRTSAEFIAEAPSEGDTILPLADYGTVLFGKDNTGLGGCTAEDSTASGVIGAFPAADIEQIIMEKKNVMESIPSSLSSDGSSFSVTWAAQ
jgi:hypothetical protein